MEFLGQATGNDGWYGRGFYFSTLPAYCHHYQAMTAFSSCVKFFFVLSSTLQPHRVTNKGAGSISIVAAWVLRLLLLSQQKKTCGCVSVSVDAWVQVLVGRPHVMHRAFFFFFWN